MPIDTIFLENILSCQKYGVILPSQRIIIFVLCKICEIMAKQFLDPMSPEVAAVIAEKAGIKNEKIIFDEIENIQSLCCVLGLSFPESATQFQKAFLTLAHLTASCRDYVLKGVDVPGRILYLIDQLNIICLDNEFKQR